MTPIEKNITVTDETGKIYEPTWPRRAAGLIKSGRARRAGPNRICLARPPELTEDENMNNTDTAETMDTQAEKTETGETAAPEAAKAPGHVDMAYILERIDRIMADTDYLYRAVEAAKGIVSAGPGDVAGQAKGEALAAAVRCRETTNQRLIALLEKMYDDAKAKEPPLDPKMLRFRQLVESLDAFPKEYAADIIRKAAQQMFVEAGAEIV